MGGLCLFLIVTRLPDGKKIPDLVETLRETMMKDVAEEKKKICS
jgi:hypothetical protein